MTIKLLSDSIYNRLVSIQKNHPILTYQNRGYDEFDKSKMTSEDKLAFDEVTKILKEHIKGFSSFQNFKLSIKSNDIFLRFQYDWSADDSTIRHYFIGVGYITLREFKSGFNTN